MIERVSYEVEVLYLDRWSRNARVAIKFWEKVWESVSETVKIVLVVYGNKALTRSNIFQWYGMFRDCRKHVEENPSAGRPTSYLSAVNIEEERQILLENRHLSFRMIAETLNISKDTVSRIVVENLDERKLFAQFEQHALTEEQNDVDLRKIYNVC